MSFAISRALNAGGIMVGTVAAHLSLFGILGVIVTTPTPVSYTHLTLPTKA